MRGILQRPPPFDLRRSLGPSAVQARAGGDAAYNRNNPPVAPSYLNQEVVSQWVNRSPFNSLSGYCMELGLVVVRQNGAVLLF